MRCFIGVTISETIKNGFTDLQNSLRISGVNVIPSSKLHITLKFMGELTEREVKDVIKKLNKINFPCFEINVCGVGVFPNSKSPRIFWAGIKSEKLTQLTKIIYSELKLTEEFKFHITLARIKKQSGEITKLISHNLRKFQNYEFGKYLTKDIKLIKSELTQMGSVYSIIYRVTLN